jgi:L-fuconolactonase
MIRTDAHHHLWELARRPHAWLDGPEMDVIHRDFTLADLAPQAKAAGIGRTVLVQVLPSLAETAEFLALAGEPDLVAGVVGWADLTCAAVPETLAALRSGPGGARLAGIRHLVQGEPDPGWLARPDVRRGLRAVADAGLVYDLLTRPRQLPAAIEAARALPGLTFVLDHLSKPPIASGALQPWATLVRELAALPNVSCKLSGMVTEAGRPAGRWPACARTRRWSSTPSGRPGSCSAPTGRSACSPPPTPRWCPPRRNWPRDWTRTSRPMSSAGPPPASTACQRPGHEGPPGLRGTQTAVA